MPTAPRNKDPLNPQGAPQWGGPPQGQSPWPVGQPPPAPPSSGGMSKGQPRNGPDYGDPNSTYTPVGQAPSPSPADLSGQGAAQTGNFPNSFVNLQAYLNANHTPPPATAAGQQSPGYYPQGQSNLDAMLHSAYYGPGNSGVASPSQTPAPSTAPASPVGMAPAAGGGSVTGPTPQPGVANQSAGNAGNAGGHQQLQGSAGLSGGQNQSVESSNPSGVFSSAVQKDRPFPRLNKYLAG